MRDKKTEKMTISKLSLLKTKDELRIPDVQRDLVWTKSQKQLLIDSLFKEYDIPKFYFQLKIEDKKKIYYVIDGQQRLNAIFSFLNSELEMSDDADNVNDEEIAKKKYSDLSTDLQTEFSGYNLDIVILEDYSQEEIDEAFLRLQNGTPLKAAEKRRAVAGSMRTVIAELAQNDVFKLCDFDDVHFAYEDICTKILKQIDEGLTNVSAQALMKYYENNPKITIENSNCKNMLKAFNFLKKAFKNKKPHFKKYAIMDITVITNSLLNSYDLNRYASQFADAYLSFQNDRVLNLEKDEDSQDPRLNEYSNAARGDSLSFIEYRQTYLKEYILMKMPYLVLKDKQRFFTPEQRHVIYRLFNGRCAQCGKVIKEDEDYHADHITAHSNGGLTQISNGQLLCPTCNESKGAK